MVSFKEEKNAFCNCPSTNVHVHELFIFNKHVILQKHMKHGRRIKYMWPYLCICMLIFFTSYSVEEKLILISINYFVPQSLFTVTQPVAQFRLRWCSAWTSIHNGVANKSQSISIIVFLLDHKVVASLKLVRLLMNSWNKWLSTINISMQALTALGSSQN